MGKGLLLTLAVVAGEIIGAFIPLIWGDDVLSFVSIIGGQIGAVLGFIGMYWLLDGK